jgi:hypothetical protein
MSLIDKAREARERAFAGEPSAVTLAAALEDALAAEARELLSEFGPDHSTDGVPSPAESGYVSSVWVERRRRRELATRQARSGPYVTGPFYDRQDRLARVLRHEPARWPPSGCRVSGMRHTLDSVAGPKRLD